MQWVNKNTSKGILCISQETMLPVIIKWLYLTLPQNNHKIFPYVISCIGPWYDSFPKFGRDIYMSFRRPQGVKAEYI